MKRSLLSLALVLASHHALASGIDSSNARVSAMGGAGFAVADFADGAVFNPALVAKFRENDNFAFVLNVGLAAQDKNDTLDDLNDLADLIDAVNGRQVTQGEAGELVALLKAVDGQQLAITGGGSLVIAIPNNTLSVALVGKSNISLAAETQVNPNDFIVIANSVCTAGAVCPRNLKDQLTSRVSASGVLVTEVGLAMAKSFTLADQSTLLVGITPKKVDIKAINYAATVADFDEDSFDDDEFVTDGDATSADIGVTLITGKTSYSLVVNNVASKEFVTANGQVYELATQGISAFGYTVEKFKAELAIDLNAVEVYGRNGKTQKVRAGVEYAPAGWLQLRAGYQTDLEDTMPNAFTAGVGLSAGAINLDLSALKGSDEAIGGVLQFGVRF